MLAIRRFWNILRIMLRAYIIVISLVSTVSPESWQLFNTHQAILDQGYPAETHYVTTPDGYILEVSRIPHGKNQTNENFPRPVVFMMHGITSAANAFVMLGSEYSIGYHMADAGFDVWMGNARGNHYSRSHITLDPDHPEEKFDFFDFTFEEIGMFDLTSMIDYILEKTSKDNLHYIGHSQGGTVFLVLASMRPEYNTKIKGAHLLAAVGYQEHFPNQQLASLSEMVDTIYRLALLQGLVEYFPFNLPEGQKRSHEPDYCFGDVKYKNMCYLVGATEIMSNDEAANVSGGASIKQFAHYGQNIRDKVFRRWHYGAKKNTEVYGTSDPPIYDLNLLSTYVTLHYSLNDNLLDERDVLAMANDIPKSKVHKVARESFLHEEYVTGTDAREMVTNHVINDIIKLEAGHYEDWVKTEEIEEGGGDDNDEDQDNVDNTEDNAHPDVPGSTSALSYNTITAFIFLFINLHI